jgi:hypothetical protein
VEVSGFLFLHFSFWLISFPLCRGIKYGALPKNILAMVKQLQAAAETEIKNYDTI